VAISNTNYVIAAGIVEAVAKMPLMTFLRQRIFTPLRMTSVADFDAGPLGAQDAEPLLRNALGPLRPAPKEAKGWLFGAGELAMTAGDLARWDIAMMNQSLLRSASYKQQQTEALLTNGLATGYGLGLSLGATHDRRRVSHGGAVSGYTSENVMYPDDHDAIIVFTNIYPGAAGAPPQIANRIADILFESANATDMTARDLTRRIYDGLMKGTIDRGLLTASANAYFTDQTLADYSTSLAPLGAPTDFSQAGESLRGGMTIRSYRVRAGIVVMSLTTMTLPDGKIDQYLIERVR
jgi:CubicO group peptidase (beta-lactamase class C family)